MRPVLRIYGEIEEGDAAWKASRVDDLVKYGCDGGPAEGIDVRINSTGGYVTEGLGLYGALSACSVPVDTYIDGVALSMGLVVAQAGRTRYMAEHAIVMIHPVQPGDGGPTDGTIAMQNSIIDILAKRATCSREEIATMMEKTTWLDASEALALGLVDKIFSGLDMTTVMDSKEFEDPESKSTKMAMAKAICQYVNKLNFLPTNKMEKDVVAKSEYDALAKNAADLAKKVKDQDDQITEATNQVKDLKTKIEAFETEAKTFKTERATNLVETAVADGKVKEEAKNSWIEKAVADFDGTKSLLESIASNRQAPVLDKNKEGELPKYTAAGVMAEITAKNQSSKF